MVFSLTSGYYNTAIGNTKGSHNTAIGWPLLTLVAPMLLIYTIGANNTAVGNTMGEHNTAVGNTEEVTPHIEWVL